MSRIKAFVSECFYRLKRFVYHDELNILILGLVTGAAVVYLFFPKTQSPLLWAIIGSILSFVIVFVHKQVSECYRASIIRTDIGKIIGPIINKEEKCVIFISEYWRDIAKGNLYLFDMKTPVIGTSHLMGTGDSTALPYIYGLLMQAGKSYKKIEVVKSYERLEDYFTENFISIGGLTNKATKNLMNNYREKIEYYFSEKGCLIIKDYENEKRYIRADEKNDYGIIIKKTNLNCDNKVIFIIAGIGSLGTAGSAYYLSNEVKGLVNDYDANDFSLIICVKREIGIKSAHEVDFDNISRGYMKGD